MGSAAFPEGERGRRFQAGPQLAPDSIRTLSRVPTAGCAGDFSPRGMGELDKAKQSLGKRKVQNNKIKNKNCVWGVEILS